MSGACRLLVHGGPRLRAEEIETLRESGLEIVHTECTEQTLAALHARRPDLLVIDLESPFPALGYELYARLRQDPAAAAVPVLVVSRGEGSDALATGYQLGATDVVAAPIDYSLLAQRVPFLLRSSAVTAHARRAAPRIARGRRFMRLAEWELDLAAQCFHWSEEAREIYGLPTEKTSVTEALLAWVLAEDRDAVTHALSGEHVIEYRLKCPDGTERIVHQEAELAVDAHDGRSLLVGMTQDVTAVRNAERHARDLAYFDGLTRLPNRAYLRHFLEQAVASARRHNGRAAVLTLDLDGFKRVNDTLGHAGGDELLREVAARITRSVRACDSVASGRHSVAARLGGDEFVVVLTNLRRPEDAAVVAKRIVDQLAVGVRVGGTEVFVSSSIGIATFPENADDADTLLGRADAAMYQAKESGRNCFHFYTASMQEAAREQMELENDLRSALARARIISARSSFGDDEHCEFHLHYQPKVEVPGGRVTGAEALLRWDSASRGSVGPASFIPLAERTGLIVPLGAWVLRMACAQAKSWSSCGPQALRVAVNVSSRQLRERGFASLVAMTLEDTALDPALLELEITEGSVMEDTVASHAVLTELRALGVRIALDDFGTGYSSLSYLTRLPIDALKIDRSFVQGGAGPRGTGKITCAIIRLAKSLGIDVVIEGVETEEQLVAVNGDGPVDVQGYLFARPMSAPVLERWLATRESSRKCDTLPVPVWTERTQTPGEGAIQATT